MSLYTKWFNLQSAEHQAAQDLAAKPTNLSKRTGPDSERFTEMDWCSGRDFRDALKRHFEPAISDFLCP